MRSGLNLLIVAGLFVALAASSLAPIRSNDYFWHLATGRWIWEHHALPLTDPFGIASSHAPWINGEWLFDAALYPLFQLGGHAAVSWTLAIVAAALFSLMFLHGERSGAQLLLIVVCWYGAEAWLRERPSAAGAVCLAIVIVLAQRPPTRWTIAGIFLTTVVWANVHPSVLIAPVVVALLSGARVPSPAQPARVRARALHQMTPTIASAIALVVNPWGIEGVLNPMRVVGAVRDFHNEEWAPSTLSEFPLFYAIVIVAALLFFWRRRTSNALVFGLLALLAIRYCRNQALFYVALPLLLAPLLPKIRDRLLMAAAAVVLIAVLAGAWFRTGIDTSKFPVDAVARLKQSRLEGRIYNTYGLGGFLIWNFYPERRAITDGRNELYIAYNAEHERALRDVREWQRFIRKWDLRLAVYDPKGRTVFLESGREVPAALVYFPPREWALVAIDEAAAVFARRDAYPAGVLARWELRQRSGGGAPPRPPQASP